MIQFNTRIAPSPTGNMHIGTARTAYLNWLVAKNTGGKFFLRIDDTDLKRSKPEYVETILKSMDFLGLNFDGDVQYQNDHKRYQDIANTLVEYGLAVKEGEAVIVKGLNVTFIPDSWTDNVVGKVETTKQDCESLTDLILIKSDGSPTYHFATVVDDMRLGVNCVIRGVDHVSNTIKQIYIYKLLQVKDENLPTYFHVGLLLGSDGKKISKRDGAVSVEEMREEGFSQEAVLNYILRMGWSPKKDNKENSVIDRDKAIGMILTEGNFRAAPSKLDLPKLLWYNKKYKNAGRSKN